MASAPGGGGVREDRRPNAVNAGSDFSGSAGAKFPNSWVRRSAVHVVGACIFRRPPASFGWRRGCDGCV